MIITITQTYGDHRKELYDVRSRDSLLKYFIESFDHDIFSFHNCSESTIEYFKKYNSSREYIVQNNISYTNSLKFMIDKLRDLKCKKLIFLQDDVFSFTQDLDQLNFIIETIKSSTIPLLNLEVRKDDFKVEIQKKMDLAHTNDEVEIWKSFTSHFSENGNYSFDDGPYVLDFDYIDIIYDNLFFKYNDVWQSENYNNQKFNFLNFPRYITNKRFFKRYNIVGMNDWNRQSELEALKKNFYYD